MQSKNSGPIRQLSFNSDSRKKVLKSQFSEDLSSASQISDLSYNSSLNIRKQSISYDQPPPTKLAWIDNANQNYKLEKYGNKNEEGIIAKKCKESKRPSTGKLVKQTSLPKDSILLSHQQLAERLRQAWKEREKSKQNLNIFLAQNVKDKSDEEHNNDVTDTESMIVNDNQAFDKLVNKPKVILPLKPDLRPNNEIDYKKIFQKRLRRTYSIDDQLKYNERLPIRSDFKRSVVVIPWQENKSIKKVKENPTSQVKMDAEEIDVCVPKIDQQFQDVKIEEKVISSEDNLNRENENSLNEPAKPIDVIIRPLTANSKREGFRNRTNTAFNESNQTEKIKPPLIRASSVPVKSSQARMKLFNPVKRKIKSAAKRKDKSTVQKVCSDDESEGSLKNKKYQRSISLSGTEVITMMSLISPEQSDAEEHVEVDIEIQKLNPVPVKPQIEEHIEKLQHTKTLTLRKTVKSGMYNMELNFYLLI